jgi:uncharacterized protein (TIGR02246 family)
MKRIVCFAACLAFAFGGAALAQDVASIQQLNNKWDDAFDKGDTVALAAMYDQDAFLLPPGSDIVKGRSAIQAFWGGAVQQLGDAKLTTIDVMKLGPSAAREIGTFSFKTKGASPQESSGKYVVVWHKVRGQWLLATDIWNASK